MVGPRSRRPLRTAYRVTTSVGVALHELAHKWFAEERGLAIHEVVYFQLDNPVGYVRHETPTSYRALLSVALAPFLVNTAVAAAAFGAADWLRRVRGFASFSPVTWVAFGLLLWLGIGCGLHAFPSRTDLATVGPRARVGNSNHRRLRSWLTTIAGVVLVFPLLVVLNACTRTQRYGSHVGYTLVVYWLASLAVEQYLTALTPLLR